MPTNSCLVLVPRRFGVGRRCGRLKLAPGFGQPRLLAFGDDLVSAGDRPEERRIGTRVPEPGEQRVEVRPRRVFRRERPSSRQAAHFGP